MSEQEEKLPDAIQLIKDNIEARIEAENLGSELLESLLPIVVSRRKFAEAREALVSAVAKLVESVNALAAQSIEVNAKMDQLNSIQKEQLVKTLEFYKKVEAQF